MHFGFALELSDIDLWNKGLLDTHLDLLSPDKYTVFPVSILFVSIKSSRRLQGMSSRHLQDMSSRRLQDNSSRHVFRASSRHVFKTSSRHVFQDILKTSCKRSSRRLGRRKIVMLKTCWRRLQDISWRRLEDVFKTNKCLLGMI